MSSTLVRHALGATLAVGLVGVSWAADSASKSSTPSTKSSTSSSTSRTGKGVLPDPALLDGSTQPAEKKSEQGMIGDFELPGDENARGGKVGGPQSGKPGGGGQQQQNPGIQVDVPLPGLPIPGAGQSASMPGGQQGGLPQLPGSQGSMGGQPGGQQGMSLPDPSASQSGQAGGQAGGAQSGDPSGKALGGAGDPNAKADGVQVGQLSGEGSSQDSLAIGEKPPPQAIGDSSMRIQTSGAASGVIGSQQQVAGATQQHEKGTGSGGKGTGGTGGGNRSEKGRTMPAGL